MVTSAEASSNGNASQALRRPRGATEVARSLHESIPAERWCVTANDLRYLTGAVWSSIQKGQIVPTGEDDFEDLDVLYGPSIYTVNEQYIKPITESAGKMSWALMRNPEGLNSEIFISHAWQEGIFEFVRKVIHSWPRGLRNAWCCMLANPQNLNIEDFLKSPSQSPFALALRASDVVLVVPNRHASVYTRLWCAYEAYIAHQEGKIILIAKSPNFHRIRRAMFFMAFAAVIGAAAGRCAHEIQWAHHVNLSWGVTCVGGIAAVGAYNLEHQRCRMILNLFCEMLCFEKMLHWHPVFHWAQEWGFPWQIHLAAYLAFFGMAAGFFCLLEVDRVSAARTAQEAQQLRRNYRGSIEHAECTQVEDARRIRAEIGGEAEEVDFAIQVLLTAGMSAPALRDIARAGVDIGGIAYSGLASSVVLLFPVDVITLIFAIVEVIYLRGTAYTRFVLSGVSVVARILLAAMVCRCSIDERCFLLKVMDKTVAGLLISFVCLCIGSSLHMDQISRFWIIFSNLGFSVMIFFALLGIRGTAKLPMGLCLLQFFFARGWPTLTAVYCYAKCCCSEVPGDLLLSDDDTSITMRCRSASGSSESET